MKTLFGPLHAVPLILALAWSGCSASSQGNESDATETAAADAETESESNPESEASESETREKPEDETRVLTPDDLALFELVPTVGDVEGGESITLSGNGFQPGATVFFGDIEAGPSTFLDHTLLNVLAPTVDGPGAVDIRVENPDGESITLVDAFRYYVPFGVDGIFPGNGPIQGGTAITIEGFGFPEEAVVLIGGRTAINIERANENSLLAITPEGLNPGPANVHVWTYAGATVLEKGYIYEEGLRLEKSLPALGHIDGNEYIQVYGEGLSNGVRVFFDDVETSSEWDEDGFLQVLTPPFDEGPASLQVESSSGEESASLPFYFYDPLNANGPLEFKALLPAAGPAAGGTAVSVVASGLSADAADTSITFDGATADVTAFSPENGTMEVFSPPGEVGEAAVELTVGSQSVTIDGGFLYEPTLTLDSVIPAEGPLEGGTEVRLAGEGMDAVTGVWFGPLPCTDITPDSDGAIIVTAPPGSEGPTTIWLEQTGERTAFEGRYSYLSGDFALYAVSPGDGPLGGGTTATLYGSGLPQQGSVVFGKQLATHYKWIDSTQIEVIVPGAAQPGLVDIKVENLAGDIAILPVGFNYINPSSGWGGTWGGIIEGALNVTVKDVWLDEGIEDAFVVVDMGGEESKQGTTNWLGQITFSDIDISGAQMITAWKEGYSASSIVEFDAENATVLLFPEQPTSNSNGGGAGAESPFSQLGTIEGKVLFNEKYLTPPPGNCPDQPLDPDSILCGECETDEQCGESGDLCTAMPNGEYHCTIACESGTECPSGYACIAVSLDEVKQCMPISGTLRIRCETTRSAPESTNPQPGEGSIADPVTGEFSILSRIGDLGVVCTGEFVDPITGEGKPQAIGAAWPIQVNKGETTAGIELELDVPLNRDVTMSIGYPPSRLLELPHHRFRALLQFGDVQEYGVHEMQRLTLPEGTGTVELAKQPEGLFGSLDGVSWLLMGGAFSEESTFVQWFPPYSAAVRRNLPGLANSHLYIPQSSGWVPIPLPVTPLSSLWGWEDGTAWAVGKDNQIYIYSDDNWTLAKTPITEDWIDVWGTGPEDVTIIGAAGNVARWLNGEWISSGQIEGVANAIGGTTEATVVGANGGLWTFDGENWNGLETGTTVNLHNIWGDPLSDELWIVGDEGTILKLSGEEVETEESGTTAAILGIMGAPNGGNIYACGEAGLLLRRGKDGEWTEIPTSTPNDLTAIWISDEGDLTVVGHMGTILQITGDEYTIEDLSLESSGAILKAVWGSGTTPKWIGGQDALFFGPLMEIPVLTTPAYEGATLNSSIAWQPVGGAFPDFTFVEIGSPWWKPIWHMVVDGKEFSLEVPDLKSLTDGSGPAGADAYLGITRVRRSGFSMESFNYFDVFFQFAWDSWATNATTTSLF